MTVDETTGPEAFRRLAVTLARAAGEVAAEGRRSWGAGRVPHETKSTETDPVTEHDRATDRRPPPPRAHASPLPSST